MPSSEISPDSLSFTSTTVTVSPDSDVSRSALILFAHGARDREWAAPLRRVQATIAARAPQMPVALAFLEFMAPDLETCFAALARDGARRIVVVPMFIAQSGHVKRDLPRRISALRAAYPDIELVLTGAIGEAEIVMQAMAGQALAWIWGKTERAASTEQSA